MTRSFSARRLATIAAVATVALVPASLSPVVAASRGESAARRGNEAAIAFELAGAITAGRYDVVASGFRPHTWVTVGASYDTVYWYSGVTDAAGRVRLHTGGPRCGTILHEAWEQGAHRMRLKASAYIGRHRQPVGRPFRT